MAVTATTPHATTQATTQGTTTRVAVTATTPHATTQATTQGTTTRVAVTATTPHATTQATTQGTTTRVAVTATTPHATTQATTQGTTTQGTTPQATTTTSTTPPATTTTTCLIPTAPTAIVTSGIGLPVAIPDDTLTPVTLNAGCSCTVANVAIAIGIDHPYVDDLAMFLLAPDGVGVLLVGRPPSAANLVAGNKITFDDSVVGALNPLTLWAGLGTGDNIPAGTYFADGDLGSFNGKTAAGNWIFEVRDFRSGDTGTIQSVELTITCETQATTPATTTTQGTTPVTTSASTTPQATTQATTQGTTTQGTTPQATTTTSTTPPATTTTTCLIPTAPTAIVTSGIGLPVAIPDDTLTPVTLNAGCSCTVANVAIAIGIDHPYVDDLAMFLLAPDGVGVLLVGRPPSAANLVAGNKITFDDSVVGALNPLTLWAGLGTGDNIPAGTYFADGDLGSFNGKTAAGNWIFEVRDFRSGDTGTIQSVELTITCE